jgi:hypothetical protein
MGTYGSVNTTLRTATAAVAAAFVVGLPLAGATQTHTTAGHQTTLLSTTVAHFDRETQTLATMRNQISSRDIVTVSVVGLTLDPPRRQVLVRATSGARHTALVAALGKATVANEDRMNGQSEDQSSLAEYLQHLGIDPNDVVAVDIDGSHDSQNPRVTVFYRGRARTS